MQEIEIDFKDRRFIFNLQKNQNVEIRIDNKTVNAKVKRGVR